MKKYSNYSFSDRKTIDRIITVKEFNSDNKNNRVPKNYGYVMPLYHGWQWKKTKRELINMFCFSPLS